MEEQVLDVAKLLKFRYLLEEKHLGEEFFKEVNRVGRKRTHNARRYNRGYNDYQYPPMYMI